MHLPRSLEDLCQLVFECIDIFLVLYDGSDYVGTSLLASSDAPIGFSNISSIGHWLELHLDLTEQRKRMCQRLTHSN